MRSLKWILSQVNRARLLVDHVKNSHHAYLSGVLVCSSVCPEQLYAIFHEELACTPGFVVSVKKTTFRNAWAEVTSELNVSILSTVSPSKSHVR
jgi:hypothetical protein